MNRQLLIGAVVSIVIVFILVILVGTGNNGTQTSPTDSNQVSNQQAETITVTADTSGFSPAQLTVKAGTRVVWINNTGGGISINSDDHPTHQLYTELNIGLVPNGSNGYIVFDVPGTYTYHDHLNPTRTGTVVVE